MKIPTIEWNGEFGEIERASDDFTARTFGGEIPTFITRHTLRQRDRTVVAVKCTTRPAIPTDSETVVDSDNFFLYEFEYRDSLRKVVLKIYVHDAYAKHLYGTERWKFIQQIVQQQAPWLWSYAERIG